jgi:hypothetical protein
MTMVVDHPSDAQRQLVLRSVSEGAFPGILFKYRAFDQFTENIFENNEVRFSSPLAFNDPFDMQIKDSGEYTPEELSIYLREHDVDDVTASVIMMQDAITSKAHVSEIVENARARTMNGIGVFCLSKRSDSVLMWSHYAGSHTGFVMGFLVTTDPSLFFTPINVKYKRDYPSHSFIRDGATATRDAIGTKSLDWTYEEEVRVVKSKRSRGRRIVFKKPFRHAFRAQGAYWELAPFGPAICFSGVATRCCMSRQLLVQRDDQLSAPCS